MKTNKTLICCFTILASALFVFSCDVPLALGTRLDIEGPLVEITAPAPRTAVQTQFVLEGRVSDENPIKELLIKASLNNEDVAKQWRYTRGRNWEVSEDFGLNWQPFDGAVWNGSEQRADWMIPIDMGIGGNDPLDGEYLFSVQAWDSGGFTDDNSYKTRVLIIDRDPPRVSVSNPYLYNRHAVYNTASESFNDAELQSIHAIGDDGIERKDPAMIGKFITQEFPFQWQIEDSHDVWSIDLRFYDLNVEIDGEPGTPLPDSYIFSYHQNLPPGPDNPPDPLYAINPNGNITVPALDNDSGFYDGGHLKTPVAGKTTIRVVAACYDSAGNPNQEKTLGFFVYWPKADWPWIAFSDGMETPEYYTDLLSSGGYSNLKQVLEENSFMIYPGRTVRATAFHAHGLTKVEYSLYAYNEETGVTSDTVMDDYDNVLIDNLPRPNGSYSTVFPWEFTPPPRTGYYVIKATSYSVHKSSEEHAALFMVQDISFPNFPVEPSPTATEPLFKFIGRPESTGRPDNVPDNHIRISGVVSDATEIVSLSMVWINPVSRNYAAMSQLQYFRDSSYAGWAEAKKLSKGETATEQPQDPINPEYPGQRYPYDPPRPNRLWNLAFNDEGLDIETGRRFYTYSISVDLDDLNIGIDKQPLNSQIFLLRAENPDGKCTIITYAPQGDTLAPSITINTVVVSREGADDVVCIPGTYQLVPKFAANDVITVTGEWTEDSTGYLDVKDYLNENMEFSINGFTIKNTITALGINVTKDPASGNATSGTFTIRADVKEAGGAFTAENMKDTLAVNAFIRDIGGNPSEAGASWLIESDNLRFLRISSLDEDKAYKDGETIEIFLEFNKPVTLKPGRSQTPVLTLNTEGGVPGRAYYKAGQNNESTRHFFTYTVQAGQNTTGNLNVNGLSIDGGGTALDANSAAWQDNGYPFTWVYTGVQGDTEEIRITRTSEHDGTEILPVYGCYVRALPVTDVQGNSDYPFTLIGGKRITVDNQAPVIQSFSASPKGWHTVGTDIYITATFSEMVRLGTPTPYLILGTGGQTSTLADDIRVNNERITFKYTVKEGDTTGTNQLQVTDFGGQVLDIPGTSMTASPTGTLTDIYLDTEVPATPTVVVFSGINGQGSPTQINPTGNRYDENLFVRITGTTGAVNLGRIEYTLNGGQNWISSTDIPINVQLENNGPYTIQARQTDQAGNVSGNSSAVSFNWDKGSLVSRIDSSTPNGTYSNLTAPNNINITVYFRNPLTFSGTQTITLNALRGAAPVTVTTAAAAGVTQLSFTYDIANNDNTPTGTGLDVTALNLTATDASGVNVGSLLTVPTAGNSLRLGERKEIIVTTGALAVSSGPAYAITASNDEAAGTISIIFNRPISKGSVGDITITQSATGYRLPAVLTEAQYNRYRNIANFNDFYTRGTNGFSGTSPDTTTKYVLNYAESAVVTPNSAGAAGTIQRLAYDFLQAEKITLPVTSQDVSVSGSTLTITLSGSNALQVLGAQYDIVIPQNCVQDSLGYRWPNAAQTYTHTTTGINRPFIRVDKKVNQDRIDTATATQVSTTRPWLEANLTNVIQTTARLDCRTPNSVVRYNATGQSYDARGVVNGTGTGVTTTGNGTADGNWRNNETAANRIDYLTQQNLSETGTGGTVYDNFGTHITVGDTEQHGYVWRISTRSRNGTNGTTNSDIYEEIAFRTVLTVQIAGMAASNLGQRPDSGDQLWIRGGDAISSSSVPGFPLTWSDEWDSLSGKRAGVRLLDLISATTQFYTTSEWKWITWEVNVETYYDILLGRHVGTDGQPNTTATPTSINEPWQYGPRVWAPQRGGWAAWKEDYKLYPGKHRWVCMQAGSFTPAGTTNFSSIWNSRPTLTPNLTAPTP